MMFFYDILLTIIIILCFIYKLQQKIKYTKEEHRRRSKHFPIDDVKFIVYIIELLTHVLNA